MYLYNVAMLPVAPPPSTEPRILLVEDDEIFADILIKRFTNSGAVIMHAKNAKDAIAVLERESPFNAILLDVALPDMDGFEILSRIRSVPAFLNIPVVIVSNFVKEKDVEWGRKLGAVRFIQKSSVMPGEIVDITLKACLSAPPLIT